jgi:hypothetical protein
MPAGYLNQQYAASFVEFGSPHLLPASRGWLLRRAIPSSPAADAMGCYPLFCCTEWNALGDDLASLSDELVSVVVVADPLGRYSDQALRSAFDSVVPFKDHFVVDTSLAPFAHVSASHGAHARRALQAVSVDVCPDPLSMLDEWERLYAALAIRRRITGMRRFSRSAFEMQLQVPGLVMFRATMDGRVVGLDLWYEQGDCAQGHLAAFDAAGYDVRASYATKWCALEYFRSRVAWINLGAGTAGDPEGGLTRFKRGWATGTRPAWLCGRVFRPDEYARLGAGHGTVGSNYFPAYRAGEFD